MKWLACTVHHPEPKAGGTFKTSFRTFTTGKSHAFGGGYVELVPAERLRYTDKLDDPNLLGEMQVTVMVKKVSVGTEQDYRCCAKALSFCFQGPADPVRAAPNQWGRTPVELDINQYAFVSPGQTDRNRGYVDIERRATCSLG